MISKIPKGMKASRRAYLLIFLVAGLFVTQGNALAAVSVAPGPHDAVVPQASPHPFPDTDGDGIENQIDPQPALASGGFSDADLPGGKTTGFIGSVDPGTVIAVTEAPNPDGVNVFVLAGPPCDDVTDDLEHFLIGQGLDQFEANGIADDVEELCVANPWQGASVSDVAEDIEACRQANDLCEDADWDALGVPPGYVTFDAIADVASMAGPNCTGIADAVEAFLLNEGIAPLTATTVRGDVLPLCQANRWLSDSADQILEDIMECIGQDDCEEAAWQSVLPPPVPGAYPQEIAEVAAAAGPACADIGNAVESFLLDRDVDQGSVDLVIADVLTLCEEFDWPNDTAAQILEDIALCIEGEFVYVCDGDLWFSISPPQPPFFVSNQEIAAFVVEALADADPVTVRVSLDGLDTHVELPSGTYLISDPDFTMTFEVIDGGPGIVKLPIGGIGVSVEEDEAVSITEVRDEDGALVELELTVLAGEVTVGNRVIREGDSIVFEDLPPCAYFNYDKAILGTGGTNKLNGTSGSDLILGFGGNDELNGNDGFDCLGGGDGDDKLSGGGGGDGLYGGAGEDNLEGGDGDDHLVDGVGNDDLESGRGADILEGDEGNDELVGGDGDDFLYGGVGDDELVGGNGADSLEGGDDNDELAGGNGADSLIGGIGDDRLDGGGGTDTCDGGDGTDSGQNCEPFTQ